MSEPHEIIKATAEVLSSGADALSTILSNGKTLSTRKARKDFQNELDEKKQKIALDRFEAFMYAAHMHNVGDLQMVAVGEIERGYNRIESLPDSELKQRLMESFLNNNIPKIESIVQSYSDNWNDYL